MVKNDFQLPEVPKPIKRGRPPIEWDAETAEAVTALASFGIDHNRIAQYVGMGKKSLYKYYREELDVSETNIHARVGRGIVQKAIQCEPAFAIFFAKSRMKWSENVTIDHCSSDGSMSPKSETVISLEGLTPETGMAYIRAAIAAKKEADEAQAIFDASTDQGEDTDQDGEDD